MRILQIIPTLGSGGAEHFVFELSNELSRQGQTVEILTLYDVPTTNPLRNGLDSRIALYTLNKERGFDPRLFWRICRFIKRHKYDIVHGHVGAIKYLMLASIMCRESRFFATIHSEASREAGRSFDKWSRQLMFRYETCVPITISEESELSFEAFYGKKAVMILNGVSGYQIKQTVRLRERENQLVFIHPASCQPIKNQLLLLSAFNRVLDAGFDVKLVWVGYKDSYPELFKSLLPLMKRNVSYLGVVDNARDYMVAADAMCLSSKMEGMPMTIIEAFSVGCPVLCTPVGGCVNLITQGENGMLSSDLTEDSYYKMLETFLLLSREERTRMSAKASESFADYSIEYCANNYLQEFKKAAK